MKTTFSILGLLLLLNLSCKKDATNSAITIEGFYLRDYSGNPLEHVGLPDSDWQFTSTLSEQELALFNFDTNLSDDNTDFTGNITPIICYPIPASTQQQYYCHSDDSLIIKIVIVNNELKTLKQIASKYKGDFLFTMDLSDRNVFQNKASYRVYFSLSAKNQPDAKYGYGDIKICDDISSGFTECF